MLLMRQPSLPAITSSYFNFGNYSHISQSVIESTMAESQFGKSIPSSPVLRNTNSHFSSFHEREISDFMIGKDI